MPRRRRNKKWISTVIIIVLLVVAGVMVWLVWENYFKEKPKTESAPTEQKSQTVIPVEPEKKEEPKPSDDEEGKSKVPQYDGNDPNKTNDITGAVTYASKNGDNLVIRVNIDQYLNGGTCSLTLRQGGGNAYSATASVIDSAATSTCEGFNVPVAGFPAGKYNIIIYINSGDKTGEITGEVEL